jgi:outer membrane receptor for Fe3+-dicitrate
VGPAADIGGNGANPMVKGCGASPFEHTSDVMRLVPGVTISQHHGGGKADQIVFRGFDSDHGTDFQVSVDVIPVNMPSNAHGQGYANLHWLIPELIDRVEIFKGSYSPHLGDFATSGAINNHHETLRHSFECHRNGRQLSDPQVSGDPFGTGRNHFQTLHGLQVLP